MKRFAAAASAAAFLLLVLVGSSVVAMTQQEAQRVEQRTALLAASPSPSDLVLGLGDDKWEGTQFPVFWVEPSGDAQPSLPPGMARLPEPGQFVVSPALDRLALSERGLAARYSDRVVLGTEGVAGGGELLAYARLPEGRDVSANLAGEISSETAEFVRVRDFGAPSARDTTFGLLPFSEPLATGAAVWGAVVFLVVPGLALLSVGLLAAGVRNGRANTPPDASSQNGALTETLVWASAGLVASAATWAVVAPRLRRVPLVGHEVVRGDLGLPLWLLLAELVACSAAATLLAIVLSSVAPWGVPVRRSADSRPVLASPLSAVLLFVAFALGVAQLTAVVLGRALPLGPMAVLAGGAVATFGLVVLVPGATRAAGSELVRRGSGPAGLAGRELRRDPRGTSRPFLGGAVLVVLASAASAYLAVYSHGDEFVPPSGESQAVFVNWRPPQAEDPSRLSRTLGTGLVASFEEGGHVHGQGEEGGRAHGGQAPGHAESRGSETEGHEHADGGHAHEHGTEDATEQSSLLLGATCPELAPHLPGTRCAADDPRTLPTWTERRLAELVAPALHEPGVPVRLVSAGEVDASGSALVIEKAPLGTLEQRVRDAAMRGLPTPHVYSALSERQHRLPIVAWIYGGLATALILLTLAYFVWLMGHRYRPPGARRSAALDDSPRERGAFAAWRFGIPYAMVLAIGLAAGLLVCVLMTVVFPGTPMPWGAFGLTAGGAVTVGLAGTWTAALVGIKDRTPGVSRRQERPAGPGPYSSPR